MLHMARTHLEARGLAGRVTVSVGDVHVLEWPDATFDLTAALGVLPWLHSPAQAIGEMTRVTRPGGYVLITSDNRERLTHLVDPIFSPALAGVRRAVGKWLRRRRLIPARPDVTTEHRYSPVDVDRMLAQAGLDVVHRATVGFGEFTLFGRRLMSPSRGRMVNDWLQHLADRAAWPLAGHGNHDLVLAVRTAVPEAEADRLGGPA